MSYRIFTIYDTGNFSESSEVVSVVSYGYISEAYTEYLTVGEEVDLTLPEGFVFGTKDRYELFGFPEGLTFDPSTRGLSGTPTREEEN